MERNNGNINGNKKIYEKETVEKDRQRFRFVFPIFIVVYVYQQASSIWVTSIGGNIAGHLDLTLFILAVTSSSYSSLGAKASITEFLAFPTIAFHFIISQNYIFENISAFFSETIRHSMIKFGPYLLDTSVNIDK